MATATKMKTTYQVAISDTATTDKEGVGTLRHLNGRTYKWVLLTSGSDTAAVGDACGYLATDENCHTVSTDVSTCFGGGTTFSQLAGQIQNSGEGTTVVPADGEYFWLLIKGKSDVMSSAPTGTTPAVGDGISLSATDGKFKIDPAATEMVGGFMLNVTGSSERALLNCPE